MDQFTGHDEIQPSAPFPVATEQADVTAPLAPVASTEAPAAEPLAAEPATLEAPAPVEAASPLEAPTPVEAEAEAAAAVEEPAVIEPATPIEAAAPVAAAAPVEAPTAPEATAPAVESVASVEEPAALELPSPAIAEAADPMPSAPAAAADASAPPPPAGPTKADERRERAQQAWEMVVSAHEAGDTVTAMVTTAVKGGLLVDMAGIRGFLPASQARVPIGTALETLVKTKVPLKIIDVDQTRHRAVVSHRRAVEDERRSRRSELLRSLQVGQTREGLVVRLADFGAFVDLGGIDGLIPMRELAFERVDKVGDVLKVGDRLPVQVLRIEENGKKISLSRKNALPDPWRDNADVVKRGAVVQGKVVGKEPRLQVELAPGIVGIVRESDADPAQYEIGEEIEVAVRSADRTTRRIVLTTMHGAAAAAAVTESSTSSGFAPLGIELSSAPRNKNRPR